MLTYREHEILECIQSGLRNKEIAAKFNVSERTIKFHVSNILAKTGVDRRLFLMTNQFRHRGIADRDLAPKSAGLQDSVDKSLFLDLEHYRRLRNQLQAKVDLLNQVIGLIERQLGEKVGLAPQMAE